MNLTPTEYERLTIFMAAEFARRNKACGILLSHPEAVALIADEMLLAARMGNAYEDIVDMAGSLLSAEDVHDGVPEMVPFVSVEASFEEGTKMIVVFDPIAPSGESDTQAVPGEIITSGGEIELNAGRRRASVEVINTGDRDIQVRSHAHFFEVNRMLEFDRKHAFGMHLDSPSGVGVRFEPGVRKQVGLVRFGGEGLVRGFADLTNGSVHSDEVRSAAQDRARTKGYKGI
jgi:urease subunit gamma/beta